MKLMENQYQYSFRNSIIWIEFIDLEKIKRKIKFEIEPYIRFKGPEGTKLCFL